MSKKRTGYSKSARIQQSNAFQGTKEQILPILTYLKAIDHELERCVDLHDSAQVTQCELGFSRVEEELSDGKIVELALEQKCSRVLESILSRVSSVLLLSSNTKEGGKTEAEEVKTETDESHDKKSLVVASVSFVRFCLKHLMKDLSVVACNQYGSHVIESFIRLMTRMLEFDSSVAHDIVSLSNEVQSSIVHLVSDSYGTYVVRALVDSLGGKVGDSSSSPWNQQSITMDAQTSQLFADSRNTLVVSFFDSISSEDLYDHGLLLDKSVSPTIGCFVALLNDQMSSRQDIIDKVLPLDNGTAFKSIERLCQSASGSRVLETFLKSLNPEELGVTYETAIVPNLKALLGSPYGRFVISRSVGRIPQLSNLIPSLDFSSYFVGNSSFSCLLVSLFAVNPQLTGKCLCKALRYKKRDKRLLVYLLTMKEDSSPVVPILNEGVKCVECLLFNGSDGDFNWENSLSYLSRQTSVFVRLCKHQAGSRLLQRVLDVGSRISELIKFKLIKRIANVALSDLVFDPYGSWVVTAAYSAGDSNLKRRIADNLSASTEEIKARNFSVYKKCELEKHSSNKKRIRESMEHEHGRQYKLRRMFADVLS